MNKNPFKEGDQVHCLLMGDGEVESLSNKVKRSVCVDFQECSIEYFPDGRLIEEGKQCLFHKGEEPKVIHKSKFEIPKKEFKVGDKVYCFLRDRSGTVTDVDVDADKDFEIDVKLDNEDRESYTVEGSPWRDSVQTLFHYDDVEPFIGDKATERALTDAERYYVAILRSIRFKQSMLYTS